MAVRKNTPPLQQRKQIQVLWCLALSNGLSCAITLVVKWFLTIWADGGYPFATTMACAHMLLQYAFAHIACKSMDIKVAALPRSVYWKLAVPIGVCSSLDLVLSNWALYYVTVTFATIVRSTTSIWNLVFSIWLGHQRVSLALVANVMVISMGFALASYGGSTSTHFEIHGFLLTLAAAMVSTLRWVLTQSLLQEQIHDGSTTSHRILAVLHTTSLGGVLSILPLVLATDAHKMAHSKFILEPKWALQSLLWILLTGCLSFALIFVKVGFLKTTSALTVSVAGNLKDVVLILIAVVVFHDPLSFVNAVGLMATTGGMLFYTYTTSGQGRDDTASREYTPLASLSKVDVQQQSEDDATTCSSDDLYPGHNENEEAECSETDKMLAWS